jgi:hypothetical protein
MVGEDLLQRGRFHAQRANLGGLLDLADVHGELATVETELKSLQAGYDKLNAATKATVFTNSQRDADSASSRSKLKD